MKAPGPGVAGGVSVSNLWGYETICDLASGIEFAFSAGVGAGAGVTAEINERGITTISGAGIGGWGGAVTIAQGMKILWGSGPCFEEKECR